jgi:chitodextrinase
MTKKIVMISFAIFGLLLSSSSVSAFVELHLPSTPITMNAHYPSSQSYFDTQLSNISNGYDIQNGTYIDWCAAKEIYINPNHDYTNTHLYSLYNTSMPSYLWHANWSKINYLLNHKIPNVNWKQIQYAIWYLLDYGNAGLNTDGWAMVHNASLYGDIYTPTYFDIIGVIADAGQNIQKQLLEIRPIDPCGDADTDGIPNILEDVNADGNPQNDDSDSDGLNNYLDPDDDGDTILTCVELNDGNQFGQDVDSDGIPNYLDTNSDGDCKKDICEGRGDIDGDGIPNYLDANDNDGPDGDLDHDGLLNALEDALGTNKTNPDSDGDSINDYIETEGGTPIDTDQDGIIDANDPDDDGDQIPTILEVTDGNLFGQDVDADGIPNYLDTDSDGDGLLDQEEGTGDHDGDSIPNYLDPDDLQAPSKVQNLTACDAKDGKIHVSWDPASDNVGVDHYELYRDESHLTNITNTTYLDTGLINGHSYTYTVLAVDAAGNQGNLSDPAIGTPTKTRTTSAPHPASQSSTPTNIAPIANTSAGEPYTGNVNETLLFNATASYDPDHDAISYHWEFGDGTTSSLEIAPHIYLAAGVYNVTLLVKDSHGATDTDSTIAVILETSTPLSPPTLTGPTEGYINTLYNFSILINESDHINKIMVNWGDGHILENNHTAASFFEINHFWEQPGIYTITVTIADENSNATTQRTINIYQPMSPQHAPESNNILLLLLAVLALALLTFFYLLGKQKKDDK